MAIHVAIRDVYFGVRTSYTEMIHVNVGVLFYWWRFTSPLILFLLLFCSF